MPGVDKTLACQWYTLPLSILDSSSDMPLNCVVALKGDQLPQSKGTMVCYLTLNVKDKQSQGSTSIPTLPTHYIERCSAFTPNGRATFRMCFYAETIYRISVSVYCIQDEEGVECVGYNVAQYTAVIESLSIMVETGTFKQPAKLKFEASLATRKFQKLMAVYGNLFYQNKCGEAHRMVEKIVCSGDQDIGLFMSIGDLITFKKT